MPLATLGRSTWLALAVLAAPLAAQSARPARAFTRIADTNTAAPGGGGNCSVFFDARDVSGKDVVFVCATTGGVTGLYGFHQGSLSRLASSATPVPGGGGSNFSIFYDVALEDGLVVFSAGWGGGGSGCAFAANEGVFLTFVGGAPIQTAISSQTSNVPCFQGVELDQGRVLVTGGYTRVDAFHNHQEGVFSLPVPGLITPLLDSSTPVPGGGGATFLGIDQDLSKRGGRFCFSQVIPNTLPNTAGIYLGDAGGFSLVADGSTPIPGGSGNFASFVGASFDGERVAFKGHDASNFTALYTATQPGDVTVVVDRNTFVPGTPFRFLGFSNPLAYDDGVLAFSGFWAGGGLGLFLAYDGGVERLLVKGDAFDGRVIDQAYCRPGDLSGNRLLARVHFQDGTVGLYRFDLHLARTL